MKKRDLMIFRRLHRFNYYYIFVYEDELFILVILLPGLSAVPGRSIFRD